MSIDDIAKLLFAEVKSTSTVDKTPPASRHEGAPAQGQKPEPNKPDPEEVQYPGYFKDGGSL